jgi:hypothetical protein
MSRYRKKRWYCKKDPDMCYWERAGMCVSSRSCPDKTLIKPERQVKQNDDVTG